MGTREWQKSHHQKARPYLGGEESLVITQGDDVSQDSPDQHLYRWISISLVSIQRYNCWFVSFCPYGISFGLLSSCSIQPVCDSLWDQ